MTSILGNEFHHPADGWYQIEAKGFHPATTEAGEAVVQVIDDKAIHSIVSRFNAMAQAGQLQHGTEMLVDREHFKHDKNKDTVAFSWMPELKAGNGIFSRQRWTNTGQAAVDGGDYRFFSTEYGGAMEEVPYAEIPADIRAQFPGRRFIRPLELTGLSLTNMPNNLGQSPITNRDPAPAVRRPAPSAAPRPASQILLAIVNRVQRETGMTFAQGWELARAIFPTVFCADCSRPARPLPLSGMAQMLQGSALTTAVALANRQPHLAVLTTSTKASPRIFNRAPDSGDLGRGVAQLRAPDALARLQSESLDAGSLFTGDWRESLCAVFKQALAASMELNGWSLEQAFDQLRETEPAFWTSAVLALCDYEPAR